MGKTTRDKEHAGDKRVERAKRESSRKSAGKLLADNRRARHHYTVEDDFEAGLVLEGWEVKAIRAGRAQLTESHVVVRRSELFLLNCHVSPLSSLSTHVEARPTRSRKLLMHGTQIRRLIGKVREAGLTLIPLNLHLSRGMVKLQVALARGKKRHDKRESVKRREWEREKGRILRGRGK